MSLRSLMQLPPSHKQQPDVELGVLTRPASFEQPPTPPATAAVAPASALQPPTSPAPPCYEFRHRFAAGRAAISVLKFAPGSADLLAWGDAAGSVFVATAEEPPRLVQVRRQATLAGCFVHRASSPLARHALRTRVLSAPLLHVATFSHPPNRMPQIPSCPTRCWSGTARQ